MDLLQKLPSIVPGSKEEQAREIYDLMQESLKKGKYSIWYRVNGGGALHNSVRELLESKGYKVFDQTKYKLKWVNGERVRGDMTRRYWIGVPGRP